jgi:hypothetical protein
MQAYHQYIWRGFAPSFVNYKKVCTRLAATSDKVYQLLAQGQWFSPGTPASSTTKTGRHDFAESGVKHQKFKFFFDLRIPITSLVSSNSSFN